MSKKALLISIILVLVVLTPVIIITVNFENNRWKNTVLFVMDSTFYNNSYLPQEKELEKIAKEKYARIIPVTYVVEGTSTGSFTTNVIYESLRHSPTHIVFSPISVGYLYKSNEIPAVFDHSRGRARLIGLTNVDKTGFFDARYSYITRRKAWEENGRIADEQKDNVAFVYNSSDKRAQEAFSAFDRINQKKILVVDEHPRNEGKDAATEIYNTLFEENDTEIIFTPYFKNIALVYNLAEKNNKKVKWVVDVEFSDLLGEDAVIINDIDLAYCLNDILDSFSITGKYDTELIPAPFIPFKRGSIRLPKEERPIEELIAEPIAPVLPEVYLPPLVTPEHEMPMDPAMHPDMDPGHIQEPPMPEGPIDMPPTDVAPAEPTPSEPVEVKNEQ